MGAVTVLDNCAFEIHFLEGPSPYGAHSGAEASMGGRLSVSKGRGRELSLPVEENVTPQSQELEAPLLP